MSRTPVLKDENRILSLMRTSNGSAPTKPLSAAKITPEGGSVEVSRGLQALARQSESG
jgi:hypothetical protein